MYVLIQLIKSQPRLSRCPLILTIVNDYLLDPSIYNLGTAFQWVILNLSVKELPSKLTLYKNVMIVETYLPSN